MGKQTSDINIDELRNVLTRLYSIRNKNLRNLNQQESKDFNLITSYISQYYGTDGYDMLYKEIVAKSSLNEKAKPGTIAGYLVGCLASPNEPIESGCSIECLTGAPTFSDTQDITKCDKNVVLAVQDENKYNFIVLMKNENTDQAILYVTQPFLSFSKEEQKELYDIGIKNVIISHYDNNVSNYIIQNTTPLKELPIRNGPLHKNTDGVSYISEITEIANDVNNAGSSSLTLTLQLILILLVLGIVGYFVWKAAKKQSEKKK